MYHQHGNISRRHTGNSGRLADILRFVEIQFLDCLSSKAVHRRIVEIRRDFSSFQLLELSYLLAELDEKRPELPADVREQVDKNLK